MRGTVDSGDPAYDPALLGSLVFFEGTQISMVITADEEKRYVLVYRTDEKGDLMLNDARDEPLTETRYGHVRIQPLERKSK